jgi:competence protein ComEA
VTLPAGSRVADALRAAGGALRERDLVTVDLAARVVDGQLLLVGVPGAGTAGPTGASVVDLNAATREQLEGLPGVGPVLAQHILDWREQHGGFRSVDELNDVPGIGDRTFASLKPLVAV